MSELLKQIDEAIAGVKQYADGYDECDHNLLELQTLTTSLTALRFVRDCYEAQLKLVKESDDE